MRVSELLCFVLLAAACSDSPGEVLCAPLAPGVTVVVSQPLTVPDTVGASDWSELWRVGGQRENQELAVPVSAAASPEGILAIPDFALQEVVLIGPDGTWLGTRFRTGPGPEELTIPVAAAWSSNGDLSVFDLGAPKVLSTGPHDTVTSRNIPPAFVASVVASGELLWAGIQPSGAVLLYPGWKRVDSEDAESLEGVIIRLAPGADHPDTLVRRTVPGISAPRLGTVPAPGWARPVAAVGQGGRMAVGGFDETYRILVFDASGVVLHQICGSGDPLPRTAAERGHVPGEDMEDVARAIQNAPVPTEFAAYGRLVVSTDGRVWVQRDRQPPVPGPGFLYGEPGAHYDVYDGIGQLVMAARIPTASYLLEVMGDTIWTFEIGEYDEVEVVAYQRKR